MDTQVREPESPDVRRDRAQAGRQERGGGADDRHARPGRRPGRGPVRRALSDGQQPGPSRGLGPRGPRRPVLAPAAAALARVRADHAASRSRSSAAIATPGTLFGPDGKVTEAVLDDLGAAGYWGLLIDPAVRRRRGAVRRVRPVPDPDGHDRADPRRAGVGPRLHRRRRSAADLRQRRAEGNGICPRWPAASGSRPSR